MTRIVASALGMAVLLAFGTWLAWSFVADGAFVAFRYAEHLAGGDGPVWNVGGEHVEGFTNFGWLAWQTLFGWLSADPLLIARVTAIVLGVVTLGLLARNTGAAGTVVSCGAFLLFLPTYFHLTGGLETVAFATVVLWAAVVGMRVLEDRTVPGWEPPLLLLVAGLLRPEGLLAVLPAVAVWFHYERGKASARVSFALAGTLGLAFFVWRWVYYGHALPRSFAETFGEPGVGAQDWVQSTLILFAPLLVLTLALLGKPGLRAIGLLLLAITLTTLVPYTFFSLETDFLYRFAFHAFPVLCLGAGVAVTELISDQWGRVLAGVVAVGWVAVVGARSPDLPVTANYGVDLDRAQVAIGKGLNNADVPRRFQQVAVSDPGAIPYYSGWKAIDYGGANTAEVVDGVDPTALVRQQRPMVVVVPSATQDAPDTVFGLRVEEATSGYTRVAAVPMNEDHWLHVYVVTGWSPQVGNAVRAAVNEAQAGEDRGRYDVTIDRWLNRLSGSGKG